MPLSFSINDRPIGPGHPPYIIAEMSGNHNRSLDRALSIVAAAATAGAHAVKIQTYTADTITMNVDTDDFRILDPANPWKGHHLYELYKDAQMPWDWHAPIMRRCTGLGMACFSTPFDDSAVDFLESLNVPAYKIASFECTHLPLIRKVARTGKPMIISTGTATLDEISEAVSAATGAGAKDIVLLKCTSQYPADAADANLATMKDMQRRFPEVQIGLSDHTMGIGVAVAAVALGATVIEKHFTLRRDDGGVDSAFSLEPQELESLVEETERAWKAQGVVHYGGTESEQGSKKHRQSIWIAADLPAGTVLKPEHLKICRPGYGLPPKEWERVLGRTLRANVTKGTRLTESLIA